MTTIITSTKNEFIKTAKSLKTKKGRMKQGCFIVEGEKCISELLNYSPELIRSVIVLEGEYAQIIEQAVSFNADVYIVKEHVLNTVSDCKTSQGIVAIAAFPEYNSVTDGFILALDGVADPQNVGTMIRTADAAGCSGVILSNESADYLSPKAVRASMGSLFHIPVFYTELSEYIEELKREGYRIAAAVMNGQPDYNYDWKKTCLVIGNEARGVSLAVKSAGTDMISVPMYGKAESLNAAVAAGVLIYKIRTN